MSMNIWAGDKQADLSRRTFRQLEKAKARGRKDCWQMIATFLQAESQLFSRQNMAGHITVGAWILSPDRTCVALIFHPKLKKWIQPGGHLEEAELPLQAALREGQEETGLKLIPLNRRIFHYDCHYFPAGKDGPPHQHFDLRYAFQAFNPEDLAGGAEIQKARWVPLKDIRRFTDEKTILAMAELSVRLYPRKK